MGPSRGDRQTWVFPSLHGQLKIKSPLSSQARDSIRLGRPEDRGHSRQHWHPAHPRLWWLPVGARALVRFWTREFCFIMAFFGVSARGGVGEYAVVCDGPSIWGSRVGKLPLPSRPLLLLHICPASHWLLTLRCFQISKMGVGSASTGPLLPLPQQILDSPNPPGVPEDDPCLLIWPEPSWPLSISHTHTPFEAWSGMKYPIGEWPLGPIDAILAALSGANKAGKSVGAILPSGMLFGRQPLP